MERIIMGKTGLEVHRLGFGGIPIQRVGEEEAIETVRYAVELGIDYIDTARGYTTSEGRIGKALKLTEKRVVVATKSFTRTADGIRQDVATSLTALQRGHIDLYQCHAVNDEQNYRQIISKAGALEGLLKAKEEGLIAHIGLSSHSLDMLDRVLDDGLFETILLCFSYLEPAARDKVIPKALEKGVGVIAMKPFSGGVLDKATLSLKFALSQPGVVVIPGVERKELVEENWKIFLGSHRLHKKELREIEEIRKMYDKAFCRRCGYCAPCTEDIPIPLILDLRGIAKTAGLSRLKAGPLQEAIVKAEQCCDCKECTTRCPYDLPIPDLIKENLEWLKGQMNADA